jgi:hypothetical protein
MHDVLHMVQVLQVGPRSTLSFTVAAPVRCLATPNMLSQLLLRCRGGVVARRWAAGACEARQQRSLLLVCAWY